ncbi:MAG TPA: TonB-dependent receptor [Bryobacteraceae bacterium]|nr:TonB-dependent receptor [Bryobacteraceae bacterium]
MLYPTAKGSVPRVLQFLNRASVAAAVCILGLGAVVLQAQSIYGSVRGTVTDPNGGSVAGAKVTLTNEGTSETHATVTNSAGQYIFSQVVPGNYTISGESAGFKKFERKGVTVATQQEETADLKLEIGAVTESVQVTEAAPLVDTSNASQGQVMNNQQVTDLPNMGRNPFLLSKLVNTVIPVGNPAYNRMEDQSGSSQISIAGGPVRGNNYLLDGIPITDADNRAIIIPSLEVVQEVNVQANTYDAEMARTGGGMFNTLMKSGTNEYHGSAYGHIRRTGMDANSFFNNAAGVPITPEPNTTWGAGFGGPIRIPKLYDGRNKTFFYLGEEHYDDTQSASQQFSLPTANERAGNFSGDIEKGGAPLIIYNPNAPLVNGVRQQFQNNVIPASQLNPVGLAIANSFQMPAYAPAYYGASDLNGSATLPCRANEMTGKIDENFTNWWHASLSYARYYSLEPGNTWFPTESAPDQWRLQRRVDATAINNLFTVNPTTVVTVRYGFNRFPNYSYDVSQGFDLTSLGFASNFANSLPRSLSQFPYISLASMSYLGTSDNNSYYVHASDNFSTNVSKELGKQSLKMGFDYRKIKAAGNDANTPTFNFSGIFTQSINTAAGTGGADVADMLLGDPNSGSAYTSTKLTDFVNYYGLYIQDQYRITPKLTLNVGLRWEHEAGMEEQNNGIQVGMSSQNNLTGTPGVVEFAGGGNPISAGDPYSNKWGPRFGFAYQLNDKTVIRGGYGIYFAPQFGIGSPISTIGYNATTSYIASTDNNLTSAGTLSNPFPSGVSQPVGKTLGAATGIGQNISLIDPAAKSPYVEQYSIDVQRQLPGSIALELGFVGSKSAHLTLGTATINANALNPAYLSQGAALTQSVTNPFYGNGGSGIVGTSSIQASQLLLPYPAFGTVGYLFDDNNKAKYYSMVVKAQKRFSHGLTFLSSFTWSRNWDESGGGAGNTLNGGAAGPQNPYNMAAEYAFSNIDSPLRWTTSFSYELPFGKGKTFLNSSNLILSNIVGGWSVNAVSTFQTGFPLEITQAKNFNSSFGYASQRPNATGVSPQTPGSLEANLGDFINSAAFSAAPVDTFGNISRTIPMRGPGQANWDMSLFKDFLIKERLKAQFRFDALNALNTPLFYGPNVSYGSSTFGQITSQANFSRELELALRFAF